MQGDTISSSAASETSRRVAGARSNIPPVTHAFVDAAAAASYHSYMIQARAAASSSAAVLFRNSLAEVIRDIVWHRYEQLTPTTCMI
ncbi:hypothetical protein CKAH01_10063 [Colletotrichum kahawae]|uniref:Uncharacterized protein n=1 Tax=Colletotrichum kahawae TaxID=34407 RepID=A0AAD9XYF3_COLKA|nr:hypothetical protein CKAH01_10063 [Colletotrichum kahawae]